MSLIETQVNSQTAVITLQRSDKLNALTPEMLRDLKSAIQEIENSQVARSIIIRAKGRAFCVGADIDRWSNLTTEEFRTSWIRLGHDTFDAIANCSLPTISAIQGMAFGGGLELALATDIRIAEKSTLFALPETSLGTVPGWGGTARLSSLIGRSRAKQMIFCAEKIDALRANDWGLINEISEDGGAEERALSLAEQINSQAPLAVQFSKLAIDQGYYNNYALELLAGTLTAGSADVREGISALRERKVPKFVGS